MRKLLIAAACISAPLGASAAHAQIADAPVIVLPDTGAADLDAMARSGELAEKLNDPALQQTLSSSVAVLGEILLDLPLAPLAEAAAKMAGEDDAGVDPDMTLRNLAGPDADRVPAELAANLPRIMGAAAGALEGAQEITPLLRDLARQIGEAARGASSQN